MIHDAHVYEHVYEHVYCLLNPDGNPVVFWSEWKAMKRLKQPPSRKALMSRSCVCTVYLIRKSTSLQMLK